MLIDMTVKDVRNADCGAARLKLDWGRGRWSVVEGEQDGWARIGFSTQGTFERKPWGVIWLWDEKPGRGRQNTVILWDTPVSAVDPTRPAGLARVLEPKDPALREGRIRWTIDPGTLPGKPPLTRIRQKILDLCREILPMPVGTFLKPGEHSMKLISSEKRSDEHIEALYKAGKKYTNCGAFPAYIAKKLNGKAKMRTKINDKEVTLTVTGGLSAAMETFARDKGIRAWVEAKPKEDRRPLPGDFYVLESSPGRFSHVGVIIDASGDRWTTADSGQGVAGQGDGFAAGYRYRDYKNGTLTGEPTQGGGVGTLKGWVNVDNAVLFPEWATVTARP